MKIALLAAGDGWHVRDLFRAAGFLEVEMVQADFRSLAAGVSFREKGQKGHTHATAIRSGDGARLDLSAVERVLVRTMPGGTLEQVVFRMDVLHSLEAGGVSVVNRPKALEAAIDKYLCAARMEASGLPVPPTEVCEKGRDALEAFERLGGDVVLKPIFGSEGRGIGRLKSLSEARSRFEELEAAGAVIYLQRFVDHPGYDFRVLTLGSEVLCGMRRVAPDGGWITNVARGGRAEPMAVSADLGALALEAARSIGADVAGVDMVPDRDGKPWLLEVNAVPGWRALAPASGVDVGIEIIRHVVRGP